MCAKDALKYVRIVFFKDDLTRLEKMLFDVMASVHLKGLGGLNWISWSNPWYMYPMFWQYVTKHWYSTAWNAKQQLAVYINLSFGIQFNLFWKSIQLETRIRGDCESWTSPMWNETYKHHFPNLPLFRGWKPTPANVLALQHFSSLTRDGDIPYVSTFISIVGRQIGKLVCVWHLSPFTMGKMSSQFQAWMVLQIWSASLSMQECIFESFARQNQKWFQP